MVAETGVSSAGFHTTVLPHARAGMTFQVPSMSGKFHGEIATATPVGSKRVYAWCPESIGYASDVDIRAWSAKKRTFHDERATSWWAWVIGLPMSRVSAIASSSACSSMRSARRCMIAWRFSYPIRGHGPSSKARRAAATARSASALPPHATVAHCSRVKGSMSGIVAPSRDGTSSPSMMCP